MMPAPLGICAVFDIDDTLYLERHYVRSGFAAVDLYVQETLGCEGFFERAWSRFLGGERGTVFNGVLGDMGIGRPSGLIDELVDVYREHDAKIELESDALECLNALLPLASLAGLSDGPLISQRAKVRALGLHKWLRPLLLTESFGVGWGKPSTRCFQKVEELATTEGRSFIYIADNPAKDFVAPLELGWRTIRIRRAGSLHEAVPTPQGVDLEVPDLGGVVEWLLAHGG